MNNRGQWHKGQSGNTKGRPRSERALANILRDTGEHDSFGDLPNKSFMARLVWQAIATGEISLVGDRTLTLSVKEWLDLVKWLNVHVDGSFHAHGLSTNSGDIPESDSRSNSDSAPQEIPKLVFRWSDHDAKIAAALRDAADATPQPLSPDSSSQLADPPLHSETYSEAYAETGVGGEASHSQLLPDE